jgi:hypothetical protein
LCSDLLHEWEISVVILLVIVLIVVLLLEIGIGIEKALFPRILEVNLFFDSLID